MSYKLIVDSDISKYQPCYIMSEFKFFETDLSKYNKIYVHVDDINAFKFRYKLFPKNVVFVSELDMILPSDVDVNVQKFGCKKSDRSFTAKVVRNNFIYQYLFGNLSQ